MAVLECLYVTIGVRLWSPSMRGNFDVLVLCVCSMLRIGLALISFVGFL